MPVPARLRHPYVQRTAAMPGGPDGAHLNGGLDGSLYGSPDGARLNGGLDGSLDGG